MPERIFKYQTVPQLQALAAQLAQALVSGSTQQLRNSHTGFLIQTGPISQVDVRRRLMDVRYEIYFRGQGDPNNNILPDPTCLSLEPTNPLQEKIMSVDPRRS